MAEHYREQYDDLTVGLDDIGDEGFFEEEDLLKYQPAETESPLARLKTLVLSIDWEITDEVLRQCNEELVRLRNQWPDEKVYLVYMQALEIICKYIYQQKTNAHPNAVKLLPVLFNNLEKVVHDESLGDEEKKQILLKDVQRFNELKEQISAGSTKDGGALLKNLKALVLSIDWEITEDDLDDLREEVLKLERVFRNKKPNLILLQGIGALAAYIQHKGGNAYVDSFSLLHDLFKALEKITNNNYSLEEQKKILFVEVEKFNKFKEVVAPTISQAALQKDQVPAVLEDDEPEGTSSIVQPAFADVAPDAVHGFQEEEEAAAIEQEEVDIEKRLESFFGDEPEEEAVEEPVAAMDSSATAEVPIEEPPATTAVVPESADSVKDETESRLEDFFGDEVSLEEVAGLDKEVALQGVDVETEADDDSDEEALPLLGGKLAPALADNDEESSFSSEALVGVDNEWEEPADDILAPTPLASESDDATEDTSIDFIDESSDFTAALADVDTEDDTIETSGVVPALSDTGIDSDDSEDGSEFEDQLGIESTLDAFFGEEPTEVVKEDASEEVDLLKEYFDDSPDETPAQSLQESEELTAGDDTDLLTEDAVEDTVDQLFDFDDDDEVAPALAGVETDISQKEETGPSEESGSGRIVDDLIVAGAVAGGVATLAVEADDSQSATDIDEDDEVVMFELAEDQPIEEIADVSDVDKAYETISEQEDDQVDFATEVQPVVEQDEILGGFVEIDEETPDGLPVDKFEELRTCVQSLGIEINEQIIDGLMYEINQMRQKMVGQPLAKSFLQLMSTVAQHIGQYQFSSDAGAYELLISILESFEKGMGLPATQGQELLLGEMCKVLNWQQIVMEDKIADERDIAESETTSEEVVGDGSVDDKKELFSEGEDELIYAVLEEEMAGDSNDIEAEPQTPAAGVDEIRSELQSLRQTLQDEISRLRAELIDKR